MTVEHRVIWQERHGPIPRGWVIHHLNGQKGDNRLENLAALPRDAPPHKIVPPYRERIRNLERLLKQPERG